MFTLLHTNDFHNHLTEAQDKRLFQERRSLGSSGLLLDAGDAIASGNVTYRLSGEAILERMSAIGYDAMTVGNREFHLTRRGFCCKLFRADFPLLCANIRAANSAKTKSPANPAAMAGHVPVRPYVVFEHAPAWRVAVFGLTVPMITDRMLVRKASSYVFDDPIRTAAAFVPRLRADYAPQLLVALTHIGIARDRELARQVPGIDVIIGGHTHTSLEQGERVGETLIAHAGAYGRYLGRIEIESGRYTATLESL